MVQRNQGELLKQLYIGKQKAYFHCLLDSFLLAYILMQTRMCEAKILNIF